MNDCEELATIQSKQFNYTQGIDLGQTEKRELLTM